VSHHERILCSACRRGTCMCRTVSKGPRFPYVCEDCARPPVGDRIWIRCACCAGWRLVAVNGTEHRHQLCAKCEAALRRP
jgi:hypothetical protein